MTAAEPSRAKPITLEELIALNDEIAALVRADVPLEPALAAMADDLPGRLRRLADAVARGIERGRPLADVLADPALQLPPAYRAVVEAGVRAGRLPAALESVAVATRRIAEIRQGVALAAVYPLILMATACLLGGMVARFVVPEVLSMMRSSGVPGTTPVAWLAAAGRWAIVWAPLGAGFIAIFGGTWWFRSRRASLFASPDSARLIGWLPWVGPVFRWTRTSAFAEILALLVENDVPLPRAVVLAAEATGDAELTAAAEDVAARLQRGETTVPGKQHARGETPLPPLLGWLLGSGQRDSVLAALRHAADTYHRRARRHAELVRTFLPVVLTAAIGGAVVLVYGLVVFWPYATTLRTLSSPFLP